MLLDVLLVVVVHLLVANGTHGGLVLVFFLDNLPLHICFFGDVRFLLYALYGDRWAHQHRLLFLLLHFFRHNYFLDNIKLTGALIPVLILCFLVVLHLNQLCTECPQLLVVGKTSICKPGPLLALFQALEADLHR